MLILRVGGTIQACFCGDVRKRSVTIVVVQGVSPQPSHKDILKMIVVVIPDHHAQIIPMPSNAGLFRNIFECAIPVVFEQAIVIDRTILHEVRHAGAIHSIDI